MSWRLAYSLDKLRTQVNQAYPNRSKASDGTIGDPAHAATPSDHNPNPQGVVCALDLTNDPAHGFDAHATAEILITKRHPDLKYVISNNRIAGAWSNWKWERYTGSNPHSKHIHISVGVGSDGKSRQPYDDTVAWTINNQEEVPMPNEGDVINAYQLYNGRPATPEEVKVYTKKPWSAADGLYYGKIFPETKALQNAPKGKFKKYDGSQLFVEETK